ncbi:MAG: prolipoprotein diacylglyceryl transferase family protein [bacterium]
MMINELFILTLALILALMLLWGFSALPQEKWQILVSMPKMKEESGIWKGINFTYYGLFTANAYVAAVAIMFALLGSLAVPMYISMVEAAVILAVCVPASRIIARLVEKQPNTFTVGGASFAGLVTAPWVFWLINQTLGKGAGVQVPVLTSLAALTSSYALGEGIGRLACISFGCCYGKPLAKSHPFFQKLFEKRNFIFFGHTKKVAYEGGLDGQKVIPIQAITSIIYTGSGLLGVYLFLNGYYAAAFLQTLITTQAWRIISEFFRADYRGKGDFSAYQIMGMISVPYAVFISWWFAIPHLQNANIVAGLRSLWNPVMILFLQFLWMSIFLFTGRSQVTEAAMSFHVVRTCPPSGEGLQRAALEIQ